MQYFCCLRQVARGFSFFAAISAVLAGCSSGSGLSGTNPVTGKVTYKGQPVGGATISFIGQGEARPATAISAADGTYHLMTLDVEGAMPGDYTVVVNKTELPDGATAIVSMEEAEKVNRLPLAQPKELLPAKYRDPTQTPLKFQVKEGPNTINFELTD